MAIVGVNLNLRALTQEDLRDRWAWLNDPEVTRYFTNLGAIPLTLAGIEEWYHALGAKSERELHFSIYLGDRHIGGAQLKAIDWRNRHAELGLFIGAQEHRGKGYGTEAARLLVEYAFQTLNLHRVWLRVDVENRAAFHCYEKCGFTREGVFHDEVYRDGSYHDSVVMSLLR